MKKIFQAITILVAFISAAGFASHRPGDCPLPPNRNLTIQSAHGCLSKGFSMQAKFLWWRSHIDNISYAHKTDEPFPIFQRFPLSISGKRIQPDFHYEPGIRIASGYDFGRDNWDVFLTWTYHYTRATDRVKAMVQDLSSLPLHQNFQLIPTWIDVLDEGASNNASFANLILATNGFARWNIRLNTLDFEMGYDYFFSRHFSMRPHLGLKTTWIDMHYLVQHDAITIIHQNLTDNFAKASARGKSDFWGVGPRFGLDGYLHIGWGFSLYGKLAGALLYGEYDASYKMLVDNMTNPALQHDITIKQENFYRLRAMSQFAMGLEWGWCFSREYFLSLHTGWETQYWWNQLEIPLFTSFQSDGDLTFSGLDVGVRFDF